MDKTQTPSREEMIKLQIDLKLRNEILKTFKKDSLKIYTLIETLKTNPNKGKKLARIGNFSLRELKYKTYRFYFILNGHKLYLFNKGQLKELLIRFIAMSKKHNQQHTIDTITQVLKILEE